MASLIGRILLSRRWREPTVLFPGPAAVFQGLKVSSLRCLKTFQAWIIGFGQPAEFKDLGICFPRLLLAHVDFSKVPCGWNAIR